MFRDLFPPYLTHGALMTFLAALKKSVNICHAQVICSICDVQREADRATPLAPLVADIVTTPAVWVNMMADFATGFGLYVFLTEGSKFIKHVILVDSSATVLRFNII